MQVEIDATIANPDALAEERNGGSAGENREARNSPR
jgi:hypothetical protein